MDEVAIALIGLFVFLTVLIGGCIYDNQKTQDHYIQCVQAVHDKPAIEIKLVCQK